MIETLCTISFNTDNSELCPQIVFVFEISSFLAEGVNFAVFEGCEAVVESYQRFGEK
jgi:hypothetical protein